MEKSEAGPSNVVKQEYSKQQEIDMFIDTLGHANRCRETNCQLSSCQKMKSVIGHWSGCSRENNGECRICDKLNRLSNYHAKRCQVDKCPVPFCQKIKNNHLLAEQKKQQSFAVLVHATTCKAICGQPLCQKMKRSLTHIKICKRRIKGGCPECTELAKLAYHHAKNCRDVGKCLAPFCPNIKRKMKKRLLTEGMHQAELMLQRLTLDQQRNTKSKSISAAADLLKLVNLDGP